MTSGDDMGLFYQRDGVAVFVGDMRMVAPRVLAPNTVDYVVTDPPYGLSFMGRDWDYAVPGPEYWRVVYDVCKPGAIMLAFGGTRTYHRLCCAIEDAGWKIRDCLMWLYGQGMPKCADVGTLIDKSKGAKREVVGSKLGRSGYHLCEGKGNGCYGHGKGMHAPGTDARLRASQITAPATSEAALFTGWALALKPAWEPIILAMKPLDGTIAHNAQTWGVAGMNIDAARIGCDGSSPAACRRASARTSGNAPMQDRTLGVATAAEANEMGKIGRRGSAEVYAAERPSEALGRWPANLLLDEEVAGLLDAQTGTLTSRFFYCAKSSRRERNKGCEEVVTWENVDLSQEVDELLKQTKAISAIGIHRLDAAAWNTILSGSNITDQSRMDIAFTVSTLTRLTTELTTCNFSLSSNISVFILDAIRTLLAAGSNLVAIADDIGRLRSSTNGEIASLLGAVSATLLVLLKISAKGRRGNVHPCVKPVNLMEYLLTLCSSPTGGVILDPFAGSGTTLVAAHKLGRTCVGIELDAHNCEIAQQRISEL